MVGDRAITEFNYRLGARDVADACFVGIEVSGAEEALLHLAGSFLRQRLSLRRPESGRDLAKTHLRHMVGGHSENARDEVLYSVEFPGASGRAPRVLAKPRRPLEHLPVSLQKPRFCLRARPLRPGSSEDGTGRSRCASSTRSAFPYEDEAQSSRSAAYSA